MSEPKYQRASQDMNTAERCNCSFSLTPRSRGDSQEHLGGGGTEKIALGKSRFHMPLKDHLPPKKPKKKKKYQAYLRRKAPEKRASAGKVSTELRGPGAARS